MAERLGMDHQGLQLFVTNSTWDHVEVRRRLAAWAVEFVGPEVLVVDDAGFAKDGSTHRGWPGCTRARWGRSGTAWSR
jgi:SRSO17 transposase